MIKIKRSLILTAAMAFTLLFTLPAISLADETVSATPTNARVYINGDSVEFDAYNINDNNYFKLRDLAYMFKGTAKQFAVDWDDESNIIMLTGNKAYTAIGGEMAPKSSFAYKQAIPTSASVILDGRALDITAYNIEGNNYFKLRDIGEAMDFSVEWDGYYRVIRIDCDRPYSTGSANAYSNGITGFIEVEVSFDVESCDGTDAESGTQTIAIPFEISGDIDELDMDEFANYVLESLMADSAAINDSGNADSYADDVVSLVNAEREKQGLSPLGTDSKLTAAAQARAEELLQKFSHDRPDGKSCFTVLAEYGVSYGYAGENIASGQKNPGGVMQSWMDSPGHRDNILDNNYDKIGVGVVKLPGNGYAWVQLFI